jgi:DNA replication initiation complex subunit (GINS family)
MADVKITYETLFDLLRRERNREELQPLDETFYQDVLTYMAEKQAQIPATDPTQVSGEGEKARIQFQNIKRILKELYDRREKKIVMLALSAVRTDAATIDQEAFLPEERTLYESLTRAFQERRGAVLNNVLQQRPPEGSTPAPKKPAPETPEPEPEQPEEPQDKQEGTKVKFLKPVPRFAGGNGEVHGPFKTGEEATLPDKIAAVLIKKGRAQEA